jgi:hypothetical protein
VRVVGGQVQGALRQLAVRTQQVCANTLGRLLRHLDACVCGVVWCGVVSASAVRRVRVGGVVRHMYR